MIPGASSTWWVRGSVWLLAMMFACADPPPPPIAPGQVFSLGPYGGPLLPGPVDLPFSGAAPGGTTRWVAEEIDGAGAVRSIYPCSWITPESESLPQVSFTPFPLPDGASGWDAGLVRRFRFQPSPGRAARRGPSLSVDQTETSLMVGNADYRIELPPVGRPLTGSARRIVRSLTVTSSGVKWAPTQVVSDLSVEQDGGRTLFAWHFDPARPPEWGNRDDRQATIRYFGIYQSPDGSPLPGVTWSAELTVYADLPLVRVAFERRQDTPRAFPFGRSFQFFFNPASTALPVTAGQVTCQLRSGDGSGGRWVAISPPGLDLSLLLHDDRMQGLGHWAKTWGYLCASWEAGESAFHDTVDRREFYLRIARRASDADARDLQVRGLATLRDMHWHAGLHALFENDNPGTRNP